MRPHPSCAIALSEDHDSPAVQASRMMPHYRSAKDCQAGHKADDGDRKETKVCSPFFRACDVRVDLCDLFDPPLLAESIPGCMSHRLSDSVQDVSAKDSSKQLHQKRSKDWNLAKDTNTRSTNATNASGVLDMIIGTAMAEQCLQDSGAHVEAGRLKDAIEPIALLAQDALTQVLSPQLVRSKVEERCRQDSEPNDPPGVNSRMRGELSLLVLALLAEHGACETIGRYIISGLAREVLSDCDLSSFNDPQKLLKRLSTALVSTCDLWKLPKAELLALLPNDNDRSSSSAMQEVVCCIGEAYYEASTDSKNEYADYHESTQLLCCGNSRPERLHAKSWH